MIRLGLSEPNEVLSDVLEAMIAALCLSEGGTFGGTDVLFSRLFLPFYSQHINLATLSPHPSAVLQQRLQELGCHEFEVGVLRNVG